MQGSESELETMTFQLLYYTKNLNKSLPFESQVNGNTTGIQPAILECRKS